MVASSCSFIYIFIFSAEIVLAKLMISTSTKRRGRFEYFIKNVTFCVKILMIILNMPRTENAYPLMLYSLKSYDFLWNLRQVSIVFSKEVGGVQSSRIFISVFSSYLFRICRVSAYTLAFHYEHVSLCRSFDTLDSAFVSWMSLSLEDLKYCFERCKQFLVIMH